jgi:putative aldouronate transport system substrate-binding protein
MKHFKIATLFGLLSLTTALVATEITAQASLPPVKLTFLMPGDIPKDLPEVQEAINKVLQAKMNATVDIQMVDYGSYDQKLNLMYASGQGCDLAFTARWLNNYGLNAVKGNFRALDDLLPKFGPNLLKLYTPGVWEGAKVKGKIYAVPDFLPTPLAVGFVARADLAKKYGLNANAIRSYSDLTPFLARVKAGEPDKLPFSSDRQLNNTPYIYGWDPIQGDLMLVVNSTDRNLRVINGFATPQFRAGVQLARRWYQAGYLAKEVQTEETLNTLRKAGGFAAAANQWTASTSDSYKSQWGYEMVGKNFSPPVVSTSLITTAMTGVCAGSKNPERAVMFMDFMASDAVFNNLLLNGLEGKHWVWKDKAKQIIDYPAGVTGQSVGYSLSWGPGLVNNTFRYFRGEADIKNRAAELTVLKAAKPSAALGFSFDATPVKNEVAQLSSVVKELGEPLFNGLVDTTTVLPQFLQRLEAAGYGKVLAEAQRQINDWKAGK